MRGYAISGIIIILIIAISVAILSCSTAEKDLPKVTLRLNWRINGDHAPFYIALDKGYFKDEGLNVEILEGTGSASTVKLIGSGSNDFGYADAGTMIKSIAAGEPVIAVGVFLQINPMAVIYLPDNPINSPKDLAGKSIALTSGDSLSQIFPALLAANGIKVNEVRIMSFPTPSAKEEALLEGNADAFLGYFIDQPTRLNVKKNLGLKWLTFNEAGVNTLSNAVIVNIRFLNEKPELIRNFLKAAQRGAVYALENRADAARITSKYRLNTKEDFESLKVEVDLALKLLHTEKTMDQPIGWSSDEDWESTLRILKDYASLHAPKNTEAFYTNAFLADIKGGYQ